MTRLTPVQEQLLSEVRSRGGRVRSLSHLTDELGISYRHAWDCVIDLENNGRVAVTRSPGLPLIISVRD